MLSTLGSGCGAAPESGAPEQTLSAPVAEDLAERADTVAGRLAEGDPCAAAAEADELVHATVAAIEAGEVPPPLQEELLANAQELVHRIDCPAGTPAPAAPPAVTPPGDDEDDDEDDEDDERGEGKGKGKGKGRG